MVGSDRPKRGRPYLPPQVWQRNSDGSSCLVTPQGHTVIIDTADLPLVAALRWSSRVCRGVVRVTGYDKATKKTRRLTSVLIGGVASPVIDHVNGNGADNRRCNLREATKAENARNMRVTARKKYSRFKGVCRTAGVKFRAYISIDGTPRHLGCFVNEEDAARAYDNAARRHFGIFACVNFPLAGEQSAHRQGVA